MLRVPLVIAEDTVTMGALVASGLLMLTLYRVRLALISKIPRNLLTVIICPIRLSGLIIVNGVIGFPSQSPPFFLGFQGPYQVNPILIWNVAKVDIFVINIIMHSSG